MKHKKVIKFYLPGIYVKSLFNKDIKEGASTLEDILTIGKALDGEEGIQIVITQYMRTIALLAWTAQAKLYYKLISVKNTSKEKIFQQTNTHSLMTKFISNSESIRNIMSLACTKRALNKRFYAINDEERESNEALLEAIRLDVNEMKRQKGVGKLNLSVKDVESRQAWIKGNISSLRSTWCSTPVFSPEFITGPNTNI